MITFLIPWFLLSIISLDWGYKTNMKSIDKKWKFILWTITVIPLGLTYYYLDATKTACKDFLFDLRSLKGGL